ncbi:MULTISPECIES: ArsR/SmtB family transcription factor [Salinibaculum]|uniref:ArsR/SmtB family transcription factor n=1 Tax=Salinibaculum TaxID=2732368 RepID=UPI0030D29856
MSETRQRLQRLLTEELGECCDSDVQDRLDELDRLRDDAFTDGLARDRAALSTLGDETRYRLARLLDTADGSLCVCELEPLVDVSESAVSHALTDLVDAGLATREKEGRWRYYAATERASAVLTAMDETRGVA